MGALELKDSILNLLNDADEKLLKVVKETIDNYKKEEIVAHTVEGKPLTRKEYKEKLDSALQRVREGHYTTHEDLLKEMKNW